MLNRFVVPVIAALLVTPTIAPPVLAQTAPETQTQTPTRPAHGAGRMAERLRQMHDRLAITPAQQPQWDAMVAALRENAQAMRATAPNRIDHPTAVQALQTASDRAQARAAAMQRMISPVQALYVSLSPDQQRTADQALAEAMRAGRGRHG